MLSHVIIYHPLDELTCNAQLELLNQSGVFWCLETLEIAIVRDFRSNSRFPLKISAPDMKIVITGKIERESYFSWHFLHFGDNRLLRESHMTIRSQPLNKIVAKQMST